MRSNTLQRYGFSGSMLTCLWSMQEVFILIVALYCPPRGILAIFVGVENIRFY